MGVCCSIVIDASERPRPGADWKALGERLVEWAFWERESFDRLGLARDPASALHRVEARVYGVGLDTLEAAWQEPALEEARQGLDTALDGLPMDEFWHRAMKRDVGLALQVCAKRAGKKVALVAF
jgi:hypothetical protein